MNRLVYAAVALTLVACSGSKGGQGAQETQSSAASTTSAAPAPPSTTVPASPSRTASPSPSQAASPSPASPSPDPAPTRSAAPDIKAQLLALGDLPAGWSRHKPSTDSSGEPACFKKLENGGAKPLAHGEVGFQGSPDGLPTLDESIAYVQKGVSADLAQVIKVLAHCGKISVPTTGGTLTGTLAPMSFPKVGDESRAYQLLLSGVVNKVQVTAGFDLLLMSVGREEVTLLYSTFGPPGLRDFQAAVTLAYDKIQGSGGGTAT